MISRIKHDAARLFEYWFCFISGQSEKRKFNLMTRYVDHVCIFNLNFNCLYGIATPGNLMCSREQRPS